MLIGPSQSGCEDAVFCESLKEAANSEPRPIRLPGSLGHVVFSLLLLIILLRKLGLFLNP